MGPSTAMSGDLDHSTLDRPQAAVSTTKSLSFPTHIKGLDKIASKVSSNTAKLSLLNQPKESGCLYFRQGREGKEPETVSREEEAVQVALERRGGFQNL